MRRRTFDTLVASAGLIVAAVLVVAGSMLWWAQSFVNDQVTSQLTAQRIFFPEKGSDSLNDPAVKPYLTKYAGQQLTTGEQAKAYADHFIKVHLNEMAGGKTYSELSTESRANPNDTDLAATVQTVFRGETLRGLLLDSYAFWKMGQIAWYGAVASFIGAAVMLVLALFGLVHARRTDEEAEILVPRHLEHTTA